jgi:hypothetical protein
MLATFGGGSANGFRSASSGSTPYPFIFYASDPISSNRNYFANSGFSHVSTYSGYPITSGGVSISGNASNYVNYTNAVGNSNLKFGTMHLTQVACALLGTQIVEVQGCRGGNMNNPSATYSPGIVYGGLGSKLTVEVDFVSLFNQYSQSGTVYIYFLSGRRGTDLLLSGTGQESPACGGGGATVMAVHTGGTSFAPIIVAGGGGGAYHNDSSQPYQRPGLYAFCPALANITTYQQWNTYPSSGTYPGNPSITSSHRPWSQHNYGTGSGSGSSWDYKSITYQGTGSYHAEIPSLHDHFKELFSNQTTPWNLINPTNSDSMSDGTVVGGFGGGGSSSYGGGGGAGYFGGFAGYYGPGSANFGKARGGQSFYDSNHCTLVSEAFSNNVFGQVAIYA